MTTPKIYVFCNSCSHEWHSFMAIAEDGTYLGGHICSSHCFAAHDMGVIETGWKRDVYAKHYPEGFHVVLVDDPKTHSGLQAAYALNQAMRVESKP